MSPGKTSTSLVTPMATSSDENSKVTPIIYFRIDYELVKNQIVLENVIMDALKASKITLKSIKITQNGNLLVYPK